MFLNTHGLALDWLRHLQPLNFESDRRRSTLADVERSLVFHLNKHLFLFNVIFLNLNVFCDKTLKILFFLLKSNYGPSTVCRYSRHSSDSLVRLVYRRLREKRFEKNTNKIVRFRYDVVVVSNRCDVYGFWFRSRYFGFGSVKENRLQEIVIVVYRSIGLS